VSDSSHRPASPWAGSGVARLALGVVLAVYVVLAWTSAARKSVTVDELGHLPAGLYTLVTGDLRYASLNPPLIDALSALPVLALDLENAIAPPPASDRVQSFWDHGYHFQEAHRSDYRHIYAVARLVPIAVVAGLGVLVFAWTRRLAPDAPAWTAVLPTALLCWSPNVIAQARLVATDSGTAAFVTLAMFALRALLRRPSLATTLAFGGALGLAQLAKPYALLLYPVALLLTVGQARLARAASAPPARLAGCLAGAFGISVLVLDAGYLGQELGRSLAAIDPHSPLLRALADSALGGVPLPLPAAYLRALDGQLLEVGSTMPSYLLGESFQGGRFDFYAVLLALKTPLGLMVAFGLGVALAIGPARLPREEAALLLAYPVTLFLLLSLSPGRQLGLRALLSATPLVWVWVGAQVARAWPVRWPAFVAGGAVAATCLASIWIWPDYLAFFNGFAGGRDAGYRYTSDANVDIGQDLPGLAAFLEDAGAERVQLLYFGSVDPALYGIDYRVPGRRLEGGWLAVSVSLYHMRYPMYDHGGLRPVGPVDAAALGEPEAIIGGSIHVYRVGRAAEGDDP
jgi:hypothetical protein